MSNEPGIGAPIHVVLLILIGMGAILVPLMPLQFRAGGAVSPDLLLPVLVAWVLRRPETAPLLLVAVLLLIADLALERPAGLWALISLLIVETARGPRTRPFVAEWASFAIALAIGLFVQGLVLSLALVPQPTPSTTIRIFAWTVAMYPLVVAVLHWILRVRAPLPADRSRRLGRVA